MYSFSLVIFSVTIFLKIGGYTLANQDKLKELKLLLEQKETNLTELGKETLQRLNEELTNVHDEEGAC